MLRNSSLNRWLTALALAVGAHGGTAVLGTEVSFAERRSEIAAMSPADQQELLRKQERFLALPQEEQERLRKLQHAIDADPKADRLRLVLRNYHEWLKSLSPSERIELNERPPAERVAKIKQIVHRQEAARRHAQSVELLSRRDMNGILEWIEDIAWQHREKLVSEMSDRMRSWFEKENKERQRRLLLHMALDRARGGDGRKAMVNIGEADIQRLSQRLSEKPKAELAKRENLQEQRKLVGGWVFSSLIERSESGRSSRRGAPLPEADVAQFFERELSARKRDELMGLSPSKQREELRRMYWQRERGESTFRGGPGPRPDGKFGPRRGPGEGGPPRDGDRPRPEKPRNPGDDAPPDSSGEPEY